MSETGARRAGENPSPQPIRVQIIPGNPPQVVPDTVTISKTQHQQVVWECTAEFTVTMEGTSPFGSAHFTRATNQSGEPTLTPDAGISLYFKYSVEVGGHVVDPGVIVNH
jgi:hypothetical protein